MTNKCTDLPFIACGLDHRDPPVGYWTFSDISNRLLPIWWGERAFLTDTCLFGRAIDHVYLGTWTGSLARLEQDAQWREIREVLRCGARDGAFEVVYEDGERLRRISPERWGGLSSQQVRDNLMYGEGWAPLLNEEAAIGKAGSAFLMRQDEATSWLSGIVSPHLLDSPISRSECLLPDRPAIFLSEALSWLAHGEVIQAEDWLNLTNENITKFENWLAHYSTGDMPKREAKCFGNFIAKETSANLREEAVEKLLIDALLEERLTAVGTQEAYGANASPETLQKNTRLMSVSLDPLHDCVRPSGRGSVEG